MKLPGKKKVLCFFALVVLSIPLVICLRKIIFGDIAFWFDPARDLLLALDNIQKPSLLGPPSGIPNIFYGPYWIWLLSVGLLFSKDPKIVVFVTQTLPYFTIVPFILSRFAKTIKKDVLSSLWLFFMYQTGIEYATKIWNPDFAPMLFFIFLWILYSTDFFSKERTFFLKTIFLGFLGGLIINFHISFGTGVFVGSYLFFLLYFCLRAVEQRAHFLETVGMFFRTLILFSCGVFLSFLPLLLFEYKHGFHQIKTIFDLVARNNIQGVTLIGMSKVDIIRTFFGKIGSLLHLPFFVGIVVTLILGCLFVYIVRARKDVSISKVEKKLFLFLASVSCSILGVYITAHNPVWDYHFIGTEVIALFFIALIVNKFIVLRKILVVWAIIVSTLIVWQQKNTFFMPSQTAASLASKESIVTTITTDGGDRDYAVFAYNPAIYNYEYSYLFQWKAHRYFSYDPVNIPRNSSLVYLIIPPAWKEIEDDFIQFRTANDEYVTTKQWNFSEGTRVLKREYK